VGLQKPHPLRRLPTCRAISVVSCWWRGCWASSRQGALTSFAVPLPHNPAAAQDTLYKRLGGYDALAAVTDDFIGRLATDPKLGRFFVGSSTDSKHACGSTLWTSLVWPPAAPANTPYVTWKPLTPVEHHRRRLEHFGEGADRHAEQVQGAGPRTRRSIERGRLVEEQGCGTVGALSAIPGPVSLREGANITLSR
jgi:hypothetical protein